MKLSQTRIVIVLAILVATSSGCGVINRIRSKNQLNEAARAYREGRFPEAEQHSREAAALDPDNKTAPMFIARTIHAQYRPGVQSPENIAKAQQAIEAYQKILDKNPQDEEAYKAIAYLYGAIKEEDKLRQWITQRAASDATEPVKRAEAYVVLASKDWDCSFKITEQPGVKTTTIDQVEQQGHGFLQEAQGSEGLQSGPVVREDRVWPRPRTRSSLIRTTSRPGPTRPTCCSKPRSSRRWMVRRSKKLSIRKTTKPL